MPACVTYVTGPSWGPVCDLCFSRWRGRETARLSAQCSLPQAAAFPQLASGAARAKECLRSVSAPGRLEVYKLDHSHVLEAIGGAWAGTLPSLPVIDQNTGLRMSFEHHFKFVNSIYLSLLSNNDFYLLEHCLDLNEAVVFHYR